MLSQNLASLTVSHPSAARLLVQCGAVHSGCCRFYTFEKKGMPLPLVCFLCSCSTRFRNICVFATAQTAQLHARAIFPAGRNFLKCQPACQCLSTICFGLNLCNGYILWIFFGSSLTVSLKQPLLLWMTMFSVKRDIILYFARFSWCGHVCCCWRTTASSSGARTSCGDLCHSAHLESFGCVPFTGVVAGKPFQWKQYPLTCNSDVVNDTSDTCFWQGKMSAIKKVYLEEADRQTEQRVPPKQTQTEHQREKTSQNCLPCLIGSWSKY